MGIMDQLGFDLTVKLPRFVVIHNNPLALLHRALTAFIIVIILYLAMKTNKFLKVVTPQGYPHMWTETGTNYQTLITSQKSEDWCADGSRRMYDYYWDTSWTYVDIGCADLSHWGEGALYAPEGSAYFPTYFEESWVEKKTGETDCNALASSCTEHANCGTATAVPAGGQCFTARPAGGDASEGVCACTRSKKDLFVLGTEQKILAMSHMFSLTKDDGARVQGYSTLTDSESGDTENNPSLLTIIQTYDAGALAWKEADCAGAVKDTSGSVNAAGECRFLPGATIRMSVAEWLSASGITNGLMETNDKAGKNLQAGQTITVDATDYTLLEYPPLRLTGVQIILQIEYMDDYFHSEADYEGTTVCYIKVTANKSWTGRPEVRYEGNLPAHGAVDGKTRSRYYEGVRFTVLNSEASRFGWPDPIQFMNYIAVMVVFLQVATYVILFISLYLLGNTSRNYQRVQRTKVNASEAASRDFPTRMMSHAVTFFQLAYLQRLGPQADEIVPGFTDIRHQDQAEETEIDKLTINRKTVERMLRAAFSSIDDITEGDIEDMVTAVWKEMSGDNESVHLCEFLELASSNEYVDFIAVQRAFDQDRRRGCMEKTLGDNVQTEATKHGPMARLINFLTSAGGIIEDEDDDKEGDQLRANLRRKMMMKAAGLNPKDHVQIAPVHSASSSSLSSGSSEGVTRRKGWFG